MGYQHIENLYKSQDVLLFKQVYVMEKVHGTSAHIAYTAGGPSNGFTYFSGGASRAAFESCFDRPRQDIEAAIVALNQPNVVVYGEAYGGSQQKMSHTYGKHLRFIVFDIQINDLWLAVPQAAELAAQLGFDFVPWALVDADAAILNAERDKPSEVAVRCGITEPRPREGIVIRPPIELRTNSGERLIAKHKGDAFKETAAPRDVADPAKLAVLAGAQAIAQEWCTAMRLEHVLDKLPDLPRDMSQVKRVIDAMYADIVRESVGEVADIGSPTVQAAISKATVALYKQHLAKEAGLA